MSVLVVAREKVDRLLEKGGLSSNLPNPALPSPIATDATSRVPEDRRFESDQTCRDKEKLMREFDTLQKEIYANITMQHTLSHHYWVMAGQLQTCMMELHKLQQEWKTL